MEGFEDANFSIGANDTSGSAEYLGNACPSTAARLERGKSIEFRTSVAGNGRVVYRMDDAIIPDRAEWWRLHMLYKGCAPEEKQAITPMAVTRTLRQ